MCSSQNVIVQLPTEECANCGLRLVRQAKEWGNYLFWSCADINIVTSACAHSLKRYHTTRIVAAGGDPVALCSGYGMLKEDGTCQCNRLFSGDHCENAGTHTLVALSTVARAATRAVRVDECWDDSDCGSHGKCHQFALGDYPQRLCYCELGWYGPKCALGKCAVCAEGERMHAARLAAESSINVPKLDMSQYNVKNVGTDNNKILWRVLPVRWHQCNAVALRWCTQQMSACAGRRGAGGGAAVRGHELGSGRLAAGLGRCRVHSRARVGSCGQCRQRSLVDGVRHDRSIGR